MGSDSAQAIPADFLEMLRRDGVLRHADATFTALADGVSSQIYQVDDGPDCFVVKRALPQLRVKDHWAADVGRNRYEQLYIEYVARFLPRAVPRLRPGARDRGYFAMECLGPEFRSWKKMLMRGETCTEHALEAAAVLGRIHAQSAGDAQAERLFRSTANFMELRIDPYLLTTGSRHPELRHAFAAEAQRLASVRQCLVHGDFSPKNIMISNSRLVLLDCEVAWYGDPAFDLAFLLTHLMLKGLYHSPRLPGFELLCRAFWQRYLEQAGSAIDCGALEPRVARLLLMLLLARIDGKSPVEYLTDPHKVAFVREFTGAGILAGWFDLSELLRRWFAEMIQCEAGQ